MNAGTGGCIFLLAFVPVAVAACCIFAVHHVHVPVLLFLAPLVVLQGFLNTLSQFQWTLSYRQQDIRFRNALVPLGVLRKRLQVRCQARGGVVVRQFRQSGQRPRRQVRSLGFSAQLNHRKLDGDAQVGGCCLCVVVAHADGGWLMILSCMMLVYCTVLY